MMAMQWLCWLGYEGCVIGNNNDNADGNDNDNDMIV